MKTFIAMTCAYAHKTVTDMKRVKTGWEEVQVSRRTSHPDLGDCLVGSYLTGAGSFNVHFPIADIRPANDREKGKLLRRQYVGARQFCLLSDDFATQHDLDQLPFVEFDEL